MPTCIHNGQYIVSYAYVCIGNLQVLLPGNVFEMSGEVMLHDITSICTHK